MGTQLLEKGYRKVFSNHPALCSVLCTLMVCVWSCRCVRCLNQPSWGRIWRSWALARTATLLSFTQIHPLLKHWACLWRGECLPCQWWMSQVTTHIVNFSVSLCNHFSVKPFLETNFHSLKVKSFSYLLFIFFLPKERLWTFTPNLMSL